jgi:hypothetical protein
LVGNWYWPNQLLLNYCSGNFPSASNLDGGSRESSAIAVADFDRDGHLDIVVGNRGQRSQLLVNDGNGNFTVSNLPGGRMYVNDIAAADLDNDGDFDILVARE